MVCLRLRQVHLMVMVVVVVVVVVVMLGLMSSNQGTC